MREKLQTLPLTQLKELAKAQGIKGVTGMRKADLIDELCRLAEQEEIIKTAVAPPQLRQTGQTETRTESRGDRYGKRSGVTGLRKQSTATVMRKQIGVSEWIEVRRQSGMSAGSEMRGLIDMRRTIGQKKVNKQTEGNGRSIIRNAANG